ncbi:Oidioi.mRNA.OKI2018_I69.PAR.g9942.t1.cds [Oikopleura dioica]|uniref:Oidioi.mRNA.OKI2018_I69.PAR.g9942.t1.cds n=1 Tax=Oikopleura dioica TaxID=34765 RepID=A0ABN7RNA7_OIKDI|nr:Oidioi.mRNA.OKI2018_I69.PAR.g9942.t1.cds [Oikopleura dioica]
MRHHTSGSQVAFPKYHFWANHQQNKDLPMLSSSDDSKKMPSSPVLRLKVDGNVPQTMRNVIFESTANFNPSSRFYVVCIPISDNLGVIANNSNIVLGKNLTIEDAASFCVSRGMEILPFTDLIYAKIFSLFIESKFGCAPFARRCDMSIEKERAVITDADGRANFFSAGLFYEVFDLVHKYERPDRSLGKVDESWRSYPYALLWTKETVEKVGPWWISPFSEKSFAICKQSPKRGQNPSNKPFSGPKFPEPIPTNGASRESSSFIFFSILVSLFLTDRVNQFIFL